ncbi:MAG: MlaD family protein [Rhabdochlamydiaceae bacterium]|nr:MlaD family protein [Rhabdochlamydiaceae bacterium]
MGEQLKNMLIGIFVLSGCALVVIMVMFLRPSVGDGKQTIYVRFANINKIGVGTRVMFGGKPVGQVVSVQDINNARNKPSVDVLGQIYYYQLVLKIDSSVKVYDTDEFAIHTAGLLGEKSIAIIPKIPPKGVAPKLITTQPVYAQSYDPIEYAFTELSEVADLMKTTIKEVNSWIKLHGEDAGKAIASFGSAMNQIDLAVKSVNDHDLIVHLKQGVNDLSATLHEVQTAVHEMNVGGVFVNAGTMMKHLASASQSMDTITQGISVGKGTLGRLLKEDDMYLRASAIMSKADTLMNDINHYGLLFNQNKGWQRQRLQRVTALNALDTPQGFRKYFENEVDEITTAMSRLSMVIDKAQQTSEKEEILGNDQFRKDFKELLRQSKELSDHLHLYNQQLMQAQ